MENIFLIVETGMKTLALDIWCIADKSKSLHNLNSEILPNFTSKRLTLFFIRYEMIFIGKAIHLYYGKYKLIQRKEIPKPITQIVFRYICVSYT